MRRQRGTSLISLMVGLVISLIVTVGLLTAYRYSVQFTSVAAQGASTDNQVASVLLRAGAAIEDAGYGITGAAFGTHIVPIVGATLSAAGGTLNGMAAPVGTPGANAIIWAMFTGTTTQCAGFYAPVAGGLLYLQPVTCADATGWQGVSWQTTPVTAQPNANASDSVPMISFTVAQQNCAPYGITTTTGRYTVTVSSPNSIGPGVNSLECLVNLQ
jgi:hypothetical protein